MKRFAFLPVLVLAVVAACQDAQMPTAGATPPAPSLALDHNAHAIPFAMSVFVPCAGEVVQLTGELHDTYLLTINGNNVTMKFHTNPTGVVGTGMITGDKYQATGVTQGLNRGSFVNGLIEFVYIDNFRVIGQGTGNNFLVHVTQHVTVTPNGVLTGEVLNSSIQCGEFKEFQP